MSAKRRLTPFLSAAAFFVCIAVSCAAEEPPIDASFDYADARAFNNAGVDFIAGQNYKEAITEFEKALAVDSHFHIARYNLALALYNCGREEEAITEFNRLLKDSRHFVNARYNLGTIYLRKQRYDEAQAELEAVADMEPRHAEGRFNLGFVYFKKNMFDKAIEEYRQGLEIKPDALKGRLSLAFIYEKKEDYRSAMEQYRHILSLRPGSEEMLFAAGSLQAIMNLKEALKADPKDTQSYMYLGHIYYSRGMYEDALAAYNEAARIEPDNKQARESVRKAVVQHFAAQELLE